MDTRLLLVLLVIALVSACTRPVSVAPEDQTRVNARIVRHYYDTWGADAIRGAVADIRPDVELHEPHGSLTFADWVEAQTWLTMTAPDARYTVDELVAQGDWVIVHWHLQGTDLEGWLDSISWGNLSG